MENFYTQTSQLGRNCNSEALILQLNIEPFTPMQLYTYILVIEPTHIHKSSKMSWAYMHTEFWKVYS